MTDDFLALVGYNNLERNDVDTVDYVSIGAESNLTENFKALAEYKINDVENEDDVFAVAARYSFYQNDQCVNHFEAVANARPG